MESLYALTNAKEAGRYYEQDNYYHKDSLEAALATHWWGEGAARLGLKDYVEPKRFIELLEGNIDANTTLERVRHDGGVSHKPGYDLTFSAPKSVSMLAEIGGDHRLYEAHDKAVNAALEYHQKHVTHYRQTIDGHTDVKASDNLIVAKFRHDTSRSVDDTVDCQLHTHCVLMNATQGNDGKWRSLHEKPLYETKMLGGMIYRATLAKELKALGYDIVKTREDGLFEIEGISREQVEHFSKRRLKILEVMNEQGLFGSAAAEKVMLALRESKTHIDRTKLHAAWQSRADSLGLDLANLIQCSKEKAPRLRRELVSASLDKEIADNALSKAVAHLGERHSVFSRRDLLRAGLQFGLGKIALNELETALTGFETEGKLIALEGKYNAPFYATPEVLAQEQAILKSIQTGQYTCPALASREAMALYLEEVKRLMPEGCAFTPGQERAIEFLCTQTDRIAGIQGYAGTGKTTLLSAVCEVARAGGYALRGAAPSASAADVLRADTAITTATLSQLLLDLKKESPSASPQKPEIILLDEASMASTAQMHTLVTEAKRLNKRIFLVGDRDQLSAVENGAPFALAQDNGLRFERLTDVIRQKANNLRYAVQETIQGDVKNAFEAIINPALIDKPTDDRAFFSPNSKVTAMLNKPKRLQAMADEYLAMKETKRRDTIILLGTNQDRRDINELIRGGLQAKGVIDENALLVNTLTSKALTQAQKSELSQFEVGDVLCFRNNHRSLNIKKFEYFKVSGVDLKQGTLELQHKQKTRQLSLAKLTQKQLETLSLYVSTERPLAKGDCIRWTQNQKDLCIFNTETAIVETVSDSNVTFQLQNGHCVTLNLSKPINQHWDYAWSSTIYAAQGKKAGHVIAQLEGANPKLTNFRSFYVTLSRAVHGISLYIDDYKKTLCTVQNHTGEKSNVSTFIEAQQHAKQGKNAIARAKSKLIGHVYEDSSLTRRLLNLAQRYVTLSNTQRVELKVADFQDKTRLNALIRTELKHQKRLDRNETQIPQLTPYRLPQQGLPKNLFNELRIRINRTNQRYNVLKGELYRISDMNSLDKTVSLQTTKGKTITLPYTTLIKEQSKLCQVYRLQRRPMSVGENIMVSPNSHHPELKAYEVLTLTAMSKTQLNYTRENGAALTLSRQSPESAYWQYAYAKGLSVPIKKCFDVGLTHLDERTRAPGRIAALLGHLGNAKNAAYISTHSKTYVEHRCSELSNRPISLGKALPDNKGSKHVLYEPLDAMLKLKSQTGKAWVSYYQNKAKGLQPSDEINKLQAMEQAKQELAYQLLSNEKTKALPLSTFNLSLTELKQQAQKHRHRLNAFKQEQHQRRHIETYLTHVEDAKRLWKNIRAHERQGTEPTQAQLQYARHVTERRNRQASYLQKHSNHYQALLERFYLNSVPLIKLHANAYEVEQRQKSQQRHQCRSKDWRMIIQADRKHIYPTQDALAPAPNNNSQISYAKKTIYYDKKTVLHAITPKAEQIISSLLEEQKNQKLSKEHKIVWGKKHGSVHYHKEGTKAGLINDYERGYHGDLITYYAKCKGLDWHSGLCELAEHHGLSSSTKALPHPRQNAAQLRAKERKQQEELKRQYKLQQLAQSTWDESTTISGTLAERYLREHRGFTGDLSQTTVRYHENAPNIVYYKNGKVIVGDRRPAMIVGFKNEDSVLTGIQCTYLDKTTANKDKRVKIPKCTIGKIWGSAGLVYNGGHEKVMVAEGTETGLSLKYAAPSSKIYITGGNMQNVGHYDFLVNDTTCKTLHIAADNDLSFDSGSWKATERGIDILKKGNIDVTISIPNILNNNKTDFNDVLQKIGRAAIKEQCEYTLVI